MNFILEDFFDDLSICDELIEYHKNNANKYEGRMRGGVDLSKKDSTDAVLVDQTLVNKYIKNLQVIVEKYIKKYPHCNDQSAWRVVELILVQHYKPKGGYYVWHCERDSIIPPFCNRHLVFMTYLNDVNDAGETEFFYQNVKFKPQKGKTLIWPADWTHTHRGIASPTEEKYIVTGWFNFV